MYGSTQTALLTTRHDVECQHSPPATVRAAKRALPAEGERLSLSHSTRCLRHRRSTCIHSSQPFNSIRASVLVASTLLALDTSTAFTRRRGLE
jgi:hypothetical protein